jgi:hypothetical protein
MLDLLLQPFNITVAVFDVRLRFTSFKIHRLFV